MPYLHNVKIQSDSLSLSLSLSLYLSLYLHRRYKSDIWDSPDDVGKTHRIMQIERGPNLPWVTGEMRDRERPFRSRAAHSGV